MLVQTTGLPIAIRARASVKWSIVGRRRSFSYDLLFANGFLKRDADAALAATSHPSPRAARRAMREARASCPRTGEGTWIAYEDAPSDRRLMKTDGPP